MKCRPKPQLHGVGPAIREARKTAGLTQMVLADRIGWPQKLVSQYEHAGERNGKVPSVLQVIRIADALECDFSYDGKTVVFTPRL